MHFDKGAPESILDRCTHVRTTGGKLLLTSELKGEVLRKIATYATGRETLRCLALATRDEPPSYSHFDLKDPKNFKDYEVSYVCSFSLHLVPQIVILFLFFTIISCIVLDARRFKFEQRL